MKRSHFLTSLILAGVLMLAACGSTTPAAATAVLTSPQQQAQFNAGDVVKIEGAVTGTDVKKVQILVNNQPVAVVDQATEPGQFTLVVDYPLPLDALGGSNVIQLKGLNEQDGAVITSEPVFIVVQAQPTATPVPPPTPTSIPTQAPAVQATAAATAAPVASANTITNKDNEFVNVRKGPGLTFDILGQLKQTQSAPAKAKSEDGKWWQIEFAGGEGGLGWIFGELVQFSGDAAALPVVKVAVPTAAAAAAQPTQPVVPLATQAPAAATPTAAPAALLPYSQSDSFAPRNDIGDVPLGHNGESNASKWSWNITGAQRAELEIVAPSGVPDLYDCPAGNLAGIQPNSAAGKRLPITLPTGEFPFTITEKGYYVFTIYVVKADGSQTTIPRSVIFGCYKKPGR
jgi:Bacterial Ig domain